ncbi:unnamed protein product [Vitrella brassicaformis CCMP3155]|uniref:Tubulin--tyrosine ligase-like protein 9 n=1 Tax=Vitrella brassicaformis (strain CCMP3155) TaxID=1169540 RepID=A0A0G4G2V9_VITBC|nr:unnamed protein product [Vitrella brassicaformis CCMP3155]|eukprot:CEM22533.1 unnamed protein product [Vitrella brassicaformis CCMP3155]
MAANIAAFNLTYMNGSLPAFLPKDLPDSLETLQRIENESIATGLAAPWYMASDFVASEYIRPHLIGGYKWHLRLHVVVVSWDPLRLFLSERDGLVLIATKPFSFSSEDPLVHLTNADVQAESNGPTYFQTPLRFVHNLAYLSLIFTNDQLNIIWRRIREVIMWAFLSVEVPLHYHVHAGMAHPDSCFEYFGVDVILTPQLRPYLLEVNRFAATAYKTHVEKAVKKAVLVGMFCLVGVRCGSLRDTEEMMLRTRLPEDIYLALAGTSLSITAPQLPLMPWIRGDVGYFATREEEVDAALFSGENGNGWNDMSGDSLEHMFRAVLEYERDIVRSEKTGLRLIYPTIETLSIQHRLMDSIDFPTSYGHIALRNWLEWRRRRRHSHQEASQGVRA